ncbi:hypothetical protein F2Q68_00014499 [Brassica cretica]|uniref:Uncharacterized protein n=2 Tax=Brassica cretica TaxID=69181 RepID=A0A3N6Q6I8_BRACR|nr:hypothetical protein F2Q68_00014499 [Brassica cretica]KAF3609913.1 hypothetical protein DY000_02046999 [Brassica cretica]
MDFVGIDSDGSSSIDVEMFMSIDGSVVASALRSVYILAMSWLISSKDVVNQLMLSFNG